MFYNRGVFGGTLAQAQYAFGAVQSYSQCDHQVLFLKPGPVNQQRAPSPLIQAPCKQLVQLGAAGAYEVIAYGGLLNAVGLTELFDHFAVTPCGQAVN